MSETAPVVLRQTDRVSLTGYVEAITDTEAVGWVWAPGEPDRLRVQLQLAGDVIADTVANGGREDLARSGIGDGNHAFTLPIPEAARHRMSELRVVALSGDGQPIRLGAPPGSSVGQDAVDRLQKNVDMLLNSQRLIHRNLQAALLQAPSTTSAVADLAAAQSRLMETLTTAELFLVRIEAALRNRDEPVPPTRRSALVTCIVMSGLAFVVSCWAVLRTIGGG